MSFGFGAISVIRGNRALLKKREFKDLKHLLLQSSGKTELEFREVSTQELARIKEEIRKKARKKARLDITVYGLLALVLLLLLGWLFIYLITS